MSVNEVTDSIKDSNIQNQQNENIINRGTGAGGSNTNKNGLNYENQKDLSTEYSIVEKTNSHMKVVFKKYPDKVFITGKKSQFMKYLSKQENKDVPKCHGTKQPDCWFIIGDNVYIVELKFQQGGGSVCEKLQTYNQKLRNFQDRYPGKKIHYIYGLHEWFRSNCKAEVYYMKKDKIPHFWGDSENFKDDIISNIINSL